MKIDDIQNLWDEDVEIDRTELGDEALKIPKLHNKYFKIYMNEKLILRKYESDLKILKLEKYEFYTQGPTDESREKGWTLPPVGKILKADVSSYMEADPDIIKLSLRIGIQNEKVDFLDSIIKSLHGRGFLIKSGIDWAKFQSGSF